MTSDLSPWHDFFMLTGGASATLLGLVFVSASIAATIPNEKLGPLDNRNIWVLPIVYAFMRVLLVSALGLVPGQTYFTYGAVLAVLGTLDTGRMFWVTRGLVGHHRQVEPLEMSDWRWYAIYPTGCSLLVLGGGSALVLHATLGMYLAVFGILGHMVIGIHNAWELAEWLASRQ